MAAPMKTHVRVKLFFDNVCVEPSWVLVELQETKNIQEFSDYICKKFLDSAHHLELSALGCKFPLWEKTLVLRDGDEIHVHLKTEKKVASNRSRNSTCLSEDNSDQRSDARYLKTHSATHQYESDHVHKQKKKKKEKDQDQRLTSKNREEDDNTTHESVINKMHKKNKKKKNKDVILNNDQPSKSSGQNIECTMDDHVDMTPVGYDSKTNNEDSLVIGKRKMRDTEYEKFGQDESENKRKKESVMEMTELSVSKSNENFVAAELKNSLVIQSGSGVDVSKKKRKRVRRRKKKNVTEDSQVGQSSVNSTPNVSFITNIKPLNMQHTKKCSQGSNVGNIHKRFDSDEEYDNSNVQNAKEMMYNSKSENVVDSMCVNQQNTSVNGSRDTQGVTYDAEIHVNNNTNHDNSYQSFRDNSYDGQVKPTTSVSVLSNGVTVYSRTRNRQNPVNIPTLSKDQQLTTKLTNKSIILQNTTKTNPWVPEDSVQQIADPTPTMDQPMYTAVPLYVDYSKFPSLIKPPGQGDKIAFKVIEMSDNYTPEISDYKEATVISFDNNSKMIEVKYEEEFTKRRSDGKFEVNLEDDNDVSWTTNESKQSLHWSSLLEPRLMSEVQ